MHVGTLTASATSTMMRGIERVVGTIYHNPSKMMSPARLCAEVQSFLDAQVNPISHLAGRLVTTFLDGVCRRSRE